MTFSSLPRKRNRPRRTVHPMHEAPGLAAPAPRAKKPRPLRRKKRLRAKPVYISPADAEHLDRVRSLVCWVRSYDPMHVCSGDVVAHHAGRHGMGLKSLHVETVPLCSSAHDELHEVRGWCADLTGEQIRDLENRAIAETQELLGVPLTVPSFDALDDAA